MPLGPLSFCHILQACSKSPTVRQLLCVGAIATDSISFYQLGRSDPDREEVVGGDGAALPFYLSASRLL